MNTYVPPSRPCQVEKLYDTKEISEMIGRSPVTIVNDRVTGNPDGIPFVRSAGCRYRASDVASWIAAHQSFLSTTQADAARHDADA